MIVEGDDTGRSQMQIVQRALASNGKKLVHVDQFPVTTLFYDAQVLKLKRSNADAVIIGTHVGVAAASILKSAESIGFHPQWLGLAGMSTYTLPDLARDLVVGLSFVAPANPVAR